MVALIMMVMAASISGYALFVYLKRSKMLKDQVEEVSVAAAPAQPCRRWSCLPCAYRTSASDLTSPDYARRCLSLHEITEEHLRTSDNQIAHRRPEICSCMFNRLQSAVIVALTDDLLNLQDAFVADDLGIKAIVIVIVGSLSAIFLISLVDFFLML